MAPIYDEAQVAQFLSYLQIPTDYYNGSQPILDHAFLTMLHKHMISTVPYDNLQLHFSKERTVNLEPQALFKKLVTDGRGRGGYCMESSLFFTYMLRALGFQVYPVGVRVRLRVDGVPTGGFPGWVHIVNIVTLADSSRWVLDVSFGGDGPTQPMPLVEGTEWRNMGTQDARLIRDFIPGQTELTAGRRMWLYQCRNAPENPWVTFYAFSHSVEWLPADFEVANWYTSTSPASFQTRTPLVVKFLRRSVNKGDGVEIYGKRMLVSDVIKENTMGKTEIVEELKTEEDRAAALKKWFDMELSEEEKESIRGHFTELKA